MEVRNFEEILSRAREQAAKKPVAVVGAHESHTLGAVIRAWEEGIADPWLIGDGTKIDALLEDMGKSFPKERILDVTDPDQMAFEGVRLVREGKALFLMKGLIETSVIMKAILNRETGIRTDQVISHINLISMPGYKKILCVTDCAIVNDQTLEKKKGILKNAVDAMREMGYERPKAAVLCAIEKVNPSMQETLDAAALKEMSLEGAFGDCAVDGPISMDIAFDDGGASSLKGYTGEVAGQPDILLMPNLVSGNILAKTLRIFAGATSVGIVLGAKVPLVLLSRSSPEKSKYCSLVVTSAMIR